MRPSRSPLFGAAVVLGALAIGSCDRGAEDSSPAGGDGSACPPCECKCECGDTGTESGGDAADTTTGDDEGVAVDPQSGTVTPHPPPIDPSAAPDISNLASEANRKMMHGDGRGCLGDLNRLKALAPQMEEHMVVTRAQCEMLIGKCQEGKAKISKWYQYQTAMTKERADKTAESIASMRCRGGDATDRDKLLVALQDLTDGAYMNKRDVAFCEERIKLVQELGPKVPPRDAEDTQVTGGQQALFHTAAMCLARAGDCKKAYQTYSALFPGHGLDQIKDPAMRTKVIKDAFDSGIVLCEGKVP